MVLLNGREIMEIEPYELVALTKASARMIS